MPYAIPPYPAHHIGTALVLGTAPNAYGDLEAALRIRPDAAKIAVNEAGRIAPCNHLVSMHKERMAEFRAMHRDAWAFAPICHAPTTLRPREDYADYPAIDYWWAGAHSNATSAWTAVWVAQGMGFDEVILCGCPMNGGDGYAVETEDSGPANPRFGFKGEESGIVRSYKENCAMYAANRGDRVYSMSGFTRDQLGPPPERPHERT